MDYNLSFHVDMTLQGLREARLGWWRHWADLATYILPRRFRWLAGQNGQEWNRGQQINTAILDSTGTTASRVLAAGMQSGITSPTRPWFHLTIEGYDPEQSGPVQRWLSEVERRMYRVFAESNTYNALATMWHDLGVFGTAAVLIYEDYDDVIRCYNLVCGEYYLANSDRYAVDQLYREFTLSVRAIVQWFGIENCGPTVQSMYRTGGSNLAFEMPVCHAIEPNVGDYAGLKVPKSFKYREVYWEPERARSDPGQFLAQRGFHEWPGLCPRWDLTSNEAYGRSPGMDALPDIKQLQQEVKRKAQAIDKMVTPPVVADVQLKNQPTSLLPGGVTYVAGINNVGVKPIYTVDRPPIQEMQLDINNIQMRIKDTFYNDIFLMISQLETVRTATEIDSRREEKLVMLGPVLTRSNNEALAPLIDRTFNIMARGRLLPPPPEEIQGLHIKVDFVSMLADAQAAVSTAAVERTLALAGNLVAVDQGIMDNINTDEAIQDYARRLRVDPRIIRDDKEIAAIRQQRARAQAAQNAAAAIPELAQAGKTLSETQVGGGVNALQYAVGGA